MTTLVTPGLYHQRLDPVPATGLHARGDVPVLLGYTTRGPVGLPVRIRSQRQLEEVFGPAPTHGFLAHAVKGFFETGGRTAYVLRVATGSARAARTAAQDGALLWRAEASFPWRMIDPRRMSAPERAEAGSWVQVVEQQLLAHGRRSPDPGTWGNALAVEIRRSSRVRTETIPDTVPGTLLPDTAARLLSTAGLEDTTVLELTQPTGRGTLRALLVPEEVDHGNRLVRWAPGPVPPGFDRARPVRVTSVEFDITVHRDGRPEQSFPALAPHPGHPSSIVRVMEAECRSLAVGPVVRRRLGGVWSDEDPERSADVLRRLDWADPASWPPEGLLRLGGGTDGLEDMTTGPWLAALAQTARLQDAALIAAPDLVLPERETAPAHDTPAAPVDCTDLAPRPRGHLRGLVTETAPDGSAVPLAGVEVDPVGPGGSAETAADGTFALTGVELGPVALRLRRPGYEPLEFLTRSSAFASAPPVPIGLTRLIAPRPLEPEEVLAVQRAMAAPDRVGPHKIAFVDPPRGTGQLDDLTAWRARLGDDARIGFFAPWLTLPVRDAAGGLLACPPSGHVCGAFAAAEHAVGIHRTGANLPLRHVEGTTLPIGDAEQAGLNPVGVNAIRVFPGRGVRVHGSRSLSSDPTWRFLTTRRVVDAIERSLERVLQWMVFEPNNLVTRQSVATTAATYLGRLHRDGVLAGTTPQAAFSVRCDLENNPREGRDEGRLVLDVAVAPTAAYEFVLFRLGRTHEALHVTEVP